MTNFENIKNYYSIFDEQHRLDKAEGMLEFEMAFRVLNKYLKMNDKVLDLGGGAGRYSIELSKLGYQVTLADLSSRLLDQARTEISENNIPELEGIDCVNATDLHTYDNDRFDFVILFGPLYHLLEEYERKKCVSEIYRVLKPGGIVCASFIPYLSGAIGIIDRAINFSDQVDSANLLHVFQSGQFHNNANVGFQEGYYPTSNEIEQLFSGFNIQKQEIRSLRSFGFTREADIYEMKEKNRELYTIILELIELTAHDLAIIETCGHAVYVGMKM